MVHGDRCGGDVDHAVLIIGLLVHVDHQILRKLVELHVGEPEWGGRSSAGAVWMRTDEGDSIDKRVKEM